MAFVSSKLRKVILSGLMAASMGVVPANGLFEEFGTFARSAVNFTLNSAKFLTAAAGLSKVATTIGVKTELIGKNGLSQMNGAFYKCGEASGCHNAAKAAKEAFVCSTQGYDNNGKPIVSNENLKEMGIDAAAFAGSVAVGKVLNGFSGKNKTEVKEKVVLREVKVPVYVNNPYGSNC